MELAEINDYLRSHAGNGMVKDGIKGEMLLSAKVQTLHPCDLKELILRVRKYNDFDGTIPSHKCGCFGFRGAIYYFNFKYRAVEGTYEMIHSLEISRSDEL
jgi:hypothetical protein